MTSCAARPARAMTAPAQTSSTLRPAARWLMTSDSAKTVQTLETVAGSLASSARRARSPAPCPMYLAVFSRKAPAPAAHLSLRRKARTRPCSSTRMAFTVCPPASSTVRASGKSRWVAYAWHVSSVTARSRRGTM